MEITTLYKRDAKDNIIRWQIHQLMDNTISVSYGIYGHKPHTELIVPTSKKVNEVQSRINAKRKEGYKSIEDLYDNAPQYIENITDKYNYLKIYLPKFNTTSEGFVLPMLAKVLKDNKPFEKYGTMLGQWKINGLRCIIGATKIEGDLFNDVALTYHSREGEDWTAKMKWMDEILIPSISRKLLDMMIEEGTCLDGELYLPGYRVNAINSFVKNDKLPQHYQLQYWCYDICIENMTAWYRDELRRFEINLGCSLFGSKEEHFNNKNQFILLPTIECANISHAIEDRDAYIRNGFEGLILRNKEAEYQFGKRNQAMFKFKKKLDGVFEIVDIKKDKRDLTIYVLRNDINSELFECTINLPQEEQKNHLLMKDIFIGKKGLVEYRERSGVKQVPFHAKLIEIYV